MYIFRSTQTLDFHWQFIHFTRMNSVKITHFLDVIKKEPVFEDHSDVPSMVLDPNDVKQEYHYKEELDVAWDERDNDYDVNQEKHNFSNGFSKKLDYPIVLVERLSNALVDKHSATIKNENECTNFVNPKTQKTSYSKYYRKLCPDCNQIRFCDKKTRECSNCGTRWIYECNKCNKRLFTYKGIISHLSTKCIEKGNYYACFKCNYKSALRYKVSTHLKNVHSIRNSSNRIKEIKSENVQNDVASTTDLHKCSKCGKQFQKLPSFLRHAQICGQAEDNDQYENFTALVNDVVQDKCFHHCIKCNQTVENDKVGSFYEKKCENCNTKFSFKCKKCNKILQTYSAINQHLKTRHAITKDVFQCPQCDYQTPYMGYLTKHVSRKHVINTLVCPECGGEYKNRTALQKHLETCNKEPTFQCDLCSHKSKSKSNLRCHVLNVHSVGNEISCPQCNIVLKNKTCLHVHLSYCKKEPQYQCTSCPFKTKYRCDLKSHCENKHSNKHKNEVCPHCATEYKNKSSLRSHLNRCGKSAELSCKYCNGLFKGRQTLTHHIIRVHSEDNNVDIAYNFPYLYCDDCSYKTKFKGDLAKHVIVHFDMKECPKCKKYFKIGYFTRHTENCGKEPLHCDHCDFQTLTKECLKRHIVNMHTKGNEINCQKCGRICKNITYLKSHLKRCGTIPHLRCDYCSYKTKSKYDLKNHVEKWHIKKRRVV